MEDNVIVLLKSINATLGRIESAAFINENKPADTDQDDQNKDNKSKKSANQQKGGMLSQLNSGLITGKDMAGSVKDIGKNLTAAKLGEAAVNLTKFSVALLKYKLIPGKNSLFKSLLGFLYGTLDELSKFDKRKLNPTLTTLELLGKAFEKMDKIDIKKISKQEKFLKGFDKVMTEIVNTLSKISKKKKDVKDSLEILKGLSDSSKLFINLGKGMLIMALAVLVFVGISKLIAMMLGVPAIAGFGVAIATFLGIIGLIAISLKMLSKDKSDIKKGNETIKDISISIAILSGAMILLGIASLIFSTKAAKKGVWLTLSIFIGLVFVLKYLSKNASEINMGVLLMPIIAIALGLLALSVLLFGVSALLIGIMANNKSFWKGILFIASIIMITIYLIAITSQIPKSILIQGIIAVAAIAGLLLLLSISIRNFASGIEKISGKTSTMWKVFGFMMASIGALLVFILALGAVSMTGIGLGLLLAGIGITALIIGVFNMFAKGIKDISESVEILSRSGDPEKNVNKLIKVIKVLIAGYSDALSEVSLKSLAKSLLGGNKMLNSIVEFTSKFADTVIKFNNFKGDISKIGEGIGEGFNSFITNVAIALDNSADIEKRAAKKISKILVKKGLLRAIMDFAKMVIDISKMTNPEKLKESGRIVAKGFGIFLQVLDDNITKDKLNIRRMKRLSKVFKKGFLKDISDFYSTIKLLGTGKFKGEDGKIYTANYNLGVKAADTYLNVLSGFINQMNLYSDKIEKLSEGLEDPAKRLNKFFKKMNDIDLDPVNKVTDAISKLSDSLAKLYVNMIQIENKRLVVPVIVNSDQVSTEQGQNKTNTNTNQQNTNSTNQTSNNGGNVTNNYYYNNNESKNTSYANNSNDTLAELQGKTVQFIFNDRSYDAIINVI